MARAVPRPDTVVMLRVGGRELPAELRVPSGRGPHPVAIVIHGGCWVTKFADLSVMRPLTEALRQAGIATFNISYRRADEDGGGWPGTFTDVAAQAAALAPLAARYSLDMTKVIATGHSAGAHLALWLASWPKLPATSAIRSTAAVPRIGAVVPLDGPGDLLGFNPAVLRVCGTPVLEQLLGSKPDSQPQRWRDASPSAWLPLGVPQALVRAGMDARLPGSGAERGTMIDYAARARAAGDSVWLLNADTTSHFALLDPEQPVFPIVLRAMKDAIAAIGSTPKRL